MKTYLFDSIERFKRFSESLDVKAVICNKSWNIFNDSGEKEIYIFQEDGSLIISNNGKVTDGSWKYIPANKSIIINGNDQSYMLHPAFMDEVIFALQVDGTQQCAFLIDESNKQSFEPKTYSELLQYFKDKELAKKHIVEEQANHEQFLLNVGNPLEHVNKEQIVWQTFKEARIKVGEKFIDVETGNYYLEEYQEFPQIETALKKNHYYMWRRIRYFSSLLSIIGVVCFLILAAFIIIGELCKHAEVKLFYEWFNKPFSNMPIFISLLFILMFCLVPIGIICFFSNSYWEEKQRKAFKVMENELGIEIPEETYNEYIKRGFTN